MNIGSLIFISLVSVALSGCGQSDSSQGAYNEVTTVSRYLQDVEVDEDVTPMGTNVPYYQFDLRYMYAGVIGVSVDHTPLVNSQGFDKTRICRPYVDGNPGERLDSFLVDVYESKDSFQSGQPPLYEGKIVHRTIDDMFDCIRGYELPVREAGEYYVSVQIITDDVASVVAGFSFTLVDVHVNIVSDTRLSLRVLGDSTIYLRRDWHIDFGQRYGFFVSGLRDGISQPAHQYISSLYESDAPNISTSTTYSYAFDVNQIDPYDSNVWSIEACAFIPENTEGVMRTSCNGEEVIGTATVTTTVL